MGLWPHQQGLQAHSDQTKIDSGQPTSQWQPEEPMMTGQVLGQSCKSSQQGTVRVYKAQGHH